MKLFERLRAQPEWQSEDPSVRANAVRKLDETAQDLFAEIAQHDEDPRVRRAAIERITELSVIVEQFTREAEHDEDIRAVVIQRIRDLLVSAEDADFASAGLELFVDERDVAVVARFAANEVVAEEAVHRIGNDKLLGGVARRSKHIAVARSALGRLTDSQELCSVAIKADEKLVAQEAYDRLVSDKDELPDKLLQEIARRASHKTVARQARALVVASELDKLPVPVVDQFDEAVVLCENIEGLRTTSVLDAGRKELEDVVLRWSRLEEPINTVVTDRFSSARRAAEDRLLALEREAVENRKVAEERLASVAPFVSLCEHVEQLSGALALEKLTEAREKWITLTNESGVQLGAHDEFSLEALVRRFDKATEGCKGRHREWNSRNECLKELQLLIVDMEAIAGSLDHDSSTSRWSTLKKKWKQLTGPEKFGSIDGDAETESVIKDLERRRILAEEAREVRNAKLMADGARDAKRNLARIERLASSIEKAVLSDKTRLQDTERYLQKIRSVLQEIPLLPSRADRSALLKRLRHGQSGLVVRVRELRDFADWQRWANLGIQEKLCQEMEALLSVANESAETDDAEIARRFRDLTERWGKVSDVPKEKGEVLWRRFKAAHDVIFPRCQVYFEQQRVARTLSLEKRRLLVGESETLRDSNDWVRTAQRFGVLQTEWKSLESTPGKEQRELWTRFRAASSDFFERRKSNLVERKKEWAVHLKQKEALCERVEALIDMENRETAIEEVKRIKGEWKTIGAVRRSKADALWTRFRGACDSIVERSKAGERAVLAERIAFREDLCGQLEALAVLTPEAGDGRVREEDTTSMGGSESLDLVRDLREKWREAPELPTEIRRKLATRFSLALDGVVDVHPDSFRGTDLDPDRKIEKLKVLCEEAESLLPSETQEETPRSPAEMLAQRLRDQLANNTMGVRVDEANRRQAAIAAVKKLQVERRKLGRCTGDAAKSLNARFQRACDRLHQDISAK